MSKRATSLVLAGAVLAALAGATGSASAATRTAPAPLSMSISPATVAVQPGLRHYAEHVKVSNTGTRTITVSTSVRLFSHGPAARSCAPAGNPGWARISPATLVVKPGQVKLARFTVTVPESIGGTQDVAGLFAAKTAGKPGTAAIGGIIAARVIMRAPGSTAIPKCGGKRQPPAAAAQQDSTGIPFAPIGGALLAVVVLVAAVLAWRNHRRSRRNPPPPDNPYGFIA